ncbi:MAG: folate-binding protein [Pseudomonadota bacterium]
MRKIFEISGKDAKPFLQNLVTNNLDAMQDGLLYTALLTPQGKYLADFFLFERAEAILLDVDATLADDLSRRLMMYRLRAAVTIEESPVEVFCGTGDAPEGAMADPRHEAMGWRLYGDISGDDGTDFDAIRVAHCIPQTGVELTGDTYILEAGFERLNGVDFRKGCYVGQEVTARMKHKTELRKGLVTVDVDGTAPAGTEIDAGGKPAGVIYTQSGSHAIAYLRFQRAGSDMTAGDAKVAWDAKTEG